MPSHVYLSLCDYENMIPNNDNLYLNIFVLSIQGDIWIEKIGGKSGHIFGDVSARRRKEFGELFGRNLADWDLFAHSFPSVWVVLSHSPQVQYLITDDPEQANQLVLS